VWLAALVLCALVAALSVSSSATSASGPTVVLRAGTGSPQTGDFTPSGPGDVTDQEFAGASDGGAGPNAYGGTIVDRSFSQESGQGVSVSGGQQAKSNPTVDLSFAGLNHYQQRYARGGNQFSVEPPDQGLCAGNGDVLEVVNDVLNVYSEASGQTVLPDNTATNIVAGFPRNVNHAVDLNSFYGYAPAINRSTGIRGPEVTDPSCIYDSATQRWFVVALTLETVPTTGAFTGVNHLDLAVSNTADPAGSWTIYRIPVQDDGTDGTPDHGCALHNDGTGHGPCLGDYPHIGADANGIYLTTNEYAFFPNFVYMGAQVYALSKAALVAGAPTIPLVHLDTAHSGVGGHPGFTLWPAQSPTPGQFNTDNGGTEYFMSSDAADEAQCNSGAVCTPGTGTSTDLLVWSLTNTSSLNLGTPSLSLTNEVLTVGRYAIPPRQQQPGSGTLPTANAPQGFCLNDTVTATIAGRGCWKLLVGRPPASSEVVSRPDSNDTRMQQVTLANGKLWGALDTALNPDGGPQRAGIEWFIVNPNSGNLVLQGYLGATGHDFSYPAIGVTPSGRGVMAFTDTGDTTYPSAAYASIDAKVGVGTWNDIALGAAPDDGFTGYKAQVGNPPRTRWGDYGAASVDGNSIWIASEYIGGSCDYNPWGGPFFGGTGDNLLGTCGGAAHGPGVRTALANWSTRISELTP
jgi:hypothetical protein